MSDSKYSLILLDPNKSNKEDDSEYDMKLYKKNVKFKINNFEKFKPKTKVNSEESEKALKGAENQVKSILSGFLRNFQSEKNNNSDIVYKQIGSLKNTNDIEPYYNKKRTIKKIRTTAYKKFIPKNSNKFNNILVGNKTDESKYSLMGSSPKVMFSHKNVKKIHFSVSPRHKRKKNESQKVQNITHFKFNNHNINKDIQTIPELNLESLKNNNINKMKQYYSGKNIKTLSKNINSNKYNGLNINTLIKKTQTQNNIKNIINFKNDEFISNNNNQKEKLNKQYSSFKNFVNNIKNNLIQFSKNKAVQSNSQNITVKKNKLNRMLTETNPKNNFQFVSNKAQRCLSPKSKKSSLFRRQQMQLLGEKNDIKSDSKNQEISLKGTNELKKILSLKKMKRSETSRDILNKNAQMEDQYKFLKLISNFKSIKHLYEKAFYIFQDEEQLFF